jgi:dTDP-6-deoxy-L-talose 4-dehydrogenase (NAD+)
MGWEIRRRRARADDLVTTRVLLTGATGFVGRQILRALAERGARVDVVLREGRIVPPEARAHLGRTLSTPDLFAERAEWWTAACEGIDVVVHAAWYAEPGEYLRSPKNMDCLAGTLELARGAARAGVRRIVGIGSCAEYDAAAGTLSTATPIRPETPYAAAKAAAYLGLSRWLPAQGVELAWCRLFHLYGEGEDARRLVPYLRERLAAGAIAELTVGQQVRDFMDVRDAGDTIAEVALGTVQGAVNVCSGVPVTVRELAERIADEYGRRDLLHFGARADSPFDPPRLVGVPTPVERR